MGVGAEVRLGGVDPVPADLAVAQDLGQRQRHALLLRALEQVLAILDQLLHEAEHLLPPGIGLPVHPAGVVVLAVTVVVAVLAAQHLVPHQQHGGSHREQGGHHHVLGLTSAQGVDLGILARPLLAVVPAEVVIAAIPVLLAVGLVVFAVVAGPVPQGEAVVAGDEVDALLRIGVVIVVDVRAAAQPLHERHHCVVIPAQEAAHVVPELAVPLAPAGAGQ